MEPERNRRRPPLPLFSVPPSPRGLRLALCIAGLVGLPATVAPAATPGDASLAPIERRIPPAGIDVPEGERKRLEEGLAKLRREVDALDGNPLCPDAEVFHKAVRLALANGEFYAKKDFDSAADLLERGMERARDLRRGRAPWTGTGAAGLLVRGFRSAVDGSVQPYGLEIPAGVGGRPGPLYVWLHGRGDKVTDLHFIRRRMSNKAPVQPGDGIVLHPFGRQCIGFKSAGETDVLEAVEHVLQHYPADPDRVVLMGFSMGGAGAWHLGAHHAERWAGVHAGAGFAETARYIRLKPADYPPAYEQALWGLYDVPGYVRNLFNLPVLAYSGEQDKQIQAARVMEEAFAAHGQELRHVIGPGMGHKYHPGSAREVAAFAREAAARGRERFPAKISIQTQTLRYPRMHWVELRGLGRHWAEARLDAEVEVEGAQLAVSITTHNVSAFALSPPREGAGDFPAGTVLEIDGDGLVTGDARPTLLLSRPGDAVEAPPAWQLVDTLPSHSPTGRPLKRPGLQGPIDDAFLDPFLVVEPGGEAWHPAVGRWVDFELAHLKERWRELFRGEVRSKRDREVTAEDIAGYHLVLWGDPASNIAIRKLLEDTPVTWTRDGVTVGAGGATFAAPGHVPVFIYPNPMNPDRYIVLNSGPTFREGHDRTNSLQNPKLPDWAVIDLSEPPGPLAPGKVAAAGFFDEAWSPRPAGSTRAE